MNPGSLHTLHQHESEHRDQARLALRECQHQADRARQQAEQLLQYRSDYQQRWSQQFRQQGGIELVQCYQSFMARLDEAIAQQQQLVQAAQVRLHTATAQLADCELRVASVGKLIDRRLAEAQRVQQQREQRSADEAAQRSHRRAHHSHGPAAAFGLGGRPA